MEIRFNSGGYFGDLERNISFTTNDPAHHAVVIGFSVRIVSLLKVDPEYAYFSRQETVSGSAKLLKLRNMSSTRIRILAIADSMGVVDLSPASGLVGPGATFAVSMTAKPVGQISRTGRIHIHLARKDQPYIMIPYGIEGSRK